MKSNIRNKRLIMSVVSIAIILLLTFLGLLTRFGRSNEPSLQSVFAFASDRAGSGDIFALDQSGELHNLTNSPEGEWDPAWSPDGKLLAFTGHAADGSDIWLMDLSQAVQPHPVWNLTNEPAWDYSPSWSPSGQSVAFVSERDGDPEIFIQHLQEDMAIQLTFNEEMDRRPAWSPDGKYIAFAAVRNGTEKIYRIRPDGTDEQLVIPAHLQGTAPAWSLDSERLAFIGWSEDNQAGIYIIGPTLENVELLYQSQAWLGSLAWSTDGQWLTYTAWETGNHEIYALSLAPGSTPVRLISDDAWDDSLAINPQAVFTPPVRSEGIAQAAPALKVVPDPDFAAGVNMADLSLAYLVNDLGFAWAKGYVNWATVQPEQGELRWVDPDNIVNAFGDQELKILMRIHGTPEWARPTDTHFSHPPTNVADFAAFMTAVVTRYKGKVAAYEIWNEPNLTYEWGYLEPDPAGYTELLKAAYKAVKAVDPDALVISGGVASTGNGSETAMGDLEFLQGMYQAGAKGYFDALGSHPYAYGLSPEASHPDGLSLDRVVAQHDLMLANGDNLTPIWITELGWVLRSSWDLGEHQMIGVTEAQQAEYLAASYSKVQQDWPFVQALFLFNLDFSTVAWYPAPEPMRWYAILNPDRTPRPAYSLLRREVRGQ